MPSDCWMPANDLVPPQKSSQLAFGVEYFLKEKFKFSIEGYWKVMNNLITFKPGETFLKNNENWDQKILVNGEGVARGLEFLIGKEQGKTKGWLSFEILV
jgi:hypothetical protein